MDRPTHETEMQEAALTLCLLRHQIVSLSNDGAGSPVGGWGGGGEQEVGWTTVANKLDAMQKAVAEVQAAAEERMGQGTGKERAERDKEQEAKDMAEEKGGQRSGERSREKVLQEESRSDKRNQQVCRCVSVCLLCV